MEDQRLTKRMLNYWNLIRKEEFFPLIQKLNPGPIEDLWPKCFQVSITAKDDKPVFKYDYIGEELIKMYGRDLSGTVLNDKSKQFPGAVIIGKLKEITHAPRPMEDEGYFVNEAGKLIKYRACFLPFGKADRQLTHIVVGLSYRIF